jgi:hypothetical protein
MTLTIVFPETLKAQASGFASVQLTVPSVKAPLSPPEVQGKERPGQLNLEVPAAPLSVTQVPAGTVVPLQLVCAVFSVTSKTYLASNFALYGEAVTSIGALTHAGTERLEPLVCVQVQVLEEGPSDTAVQM